MNHIFCSLDSDAVDRPSLWPELLALTCTAWSDKTGKCYFPYTPLTTLEYWQTTVAEQWASKEMISWMAVDDGRIIAHVALVKKGDYYELGRWVSYADNPKGIVTHLCRAASAYAQDRSWRVLVEATQAHTTSQYISRGLGFRFAGLGFWKDPWHIIYFDNMPLPDFSATSGILGNPMGNNIPMQVEWVGPLVEALDTLTTERGGEIPPKGWHVLPDLLLPTRSILESNRR